jgi:hypothetical protein
VVLGAVAGFEGVVGAAGVDVSSVVADDVESVDDAADTTTKEVRTNIKAKESAMIFFKVGTSFLF